MIMPWIQLLFILPFYYAVFRRNVDWSTYDHLWWIARFKFERNETTKIYRQVRKAICIITVGLFSYTAGGIFLANRLHWHGSELYLCFLVFLLPYAATAGSMLGLQYFTLWLRCREDFLAFKSSATSNN
jgi:hypothetical protein